MFNSLLSAVKPGLKLKTPSLPGWGFWFITKCVLFVVLLFAVGLTTLYSTNNPLNCVPVNSSAALKDLTDKNCLAELTRNAANADDDLITFWSIVISLSTKACVCISIWYLWSALDSGHFQFLLNGKDIEDDETKDDDVPTTPTRPEFSWVMMNKPARRMKSFIGSYLCHHRSMHKMYVLQFIGCEVVMFFAVVAQMFFIDWMMNQHFIAIGLYLFQYRVMQIGDTDPLLEVFKIRVNCTLKPFGIDEGTVSGYSTVCIMNLNSVNETIVVCMWFLQLMELSVAFGRMCYWALMSIARIRRWILTCKWSRLSDMELVNRFLEKTNFYEHVLVNAIIRHVDVEKSTNILQQVCQDMPCAGEIEMGRMRNRITNRDYKS